MEKIVTVLKQIIDREGDSFLKSSPFEVYQMLQEEKITAGDCRAVLCTLLADIPQKAKAGSNITDLSKAIQGNCYFRKAVSDKLAEMYQSLFCAENKSEWKEQLDRGFQEFCDQTWTFEWSGYASWKRNGGHIDCSASASFELRVKNKELFRKQISGRLKSNPFTTADWIFKHFQQLLSNRLNDDIKEYVEDDDDYYPPVMEDYWYNCQDDFEDYCRGLGFEFVSFEGDADMDDFEPDHYGRRW